MIAGTFMLTDSVNTSFDNIFSESNSGVDVSIKTKETIEDSRGALPPAFDAAAQRDAVDLAGRPSGAGVLAVGATGQIPRRLPRHQPE